MRNTPEKLEGMILKECLEEHGCPKCGSKSVVLTGTQTLTMHSSHYFKCEDCDYLGTIGFKDFPNWNCNSQQMITIGMMIQMGEDWRAYLKRQQIEPDLGEVRISVYEDWTHEF